MSFSIKSILMKKNSKGALELSITGIVVLIIAITVLGLAIGFIRKLFVGSQQQLETRLSNVNDQYKQELQSSGELLVFSVPAEVPVGNPQNALLGVRNTYKNMEGNGKICYRVE